MSLFEWFATVTSVGLSWVCLSFPYLVEKLVMVIKEIWSRL